jgi:hypothetical protein
MNSSGFHHAPIRCERFPRGLIRVYAMRGRIAQPPPHLLRQRPFPASLVSRPTGAGVGTLAARCPRAAGCRASTGRLPSTTLDTSRIHLFTQSIAAGTGPRQATKRALGQVSLPQTITRSSSSDYASQTAITYSDSGRAHTMRWRYSRHRSQPPERALPLLFPRVGGALPTPPMHSFFVFSCIVS